MANRNNNNLMATAVDYVNTGSSKNNSRLLSNMFNGKFRGSNITPKKKKRKK